MAFAESPLKRWLAEQCNFVRNSDRFVWSKHVSHFSEVYWLVQSCIRWLQTETRPFSLQLYLAHHISRCNAESGDE